VHAIIAAMEITGVAVMEAFTSARRTLSFKTQPSAKHCGVGTSSLLHIRHDRDDDFRVARYNSDAEHCHSKYRHSCHQRRT